MINKLTYRLHGEKGSAYAYVMPISEADNLKPRLNSIGGPITAQICSSRKAASDIVNRWNAGFIANGEHLFTSPCF